MVPLHRTSALVRRPVLYRDVRLGTAAEALFDRSIRRLVGLDVSCGDGKDRLLPFPACEVRDDRIVVESALVLLEGNVDFYRLEGCTFGELRGSSVRGGGLELGRLADLLVGDEGEVVRIVVVTDEGERAVDAAGIVVGDERLRPAV